MTKKKSVWENLSSINCDHLTEQKGPKKLTYLSWSDSWSMLKKQYPEANYTVYENHQGYNYHHDNKTAWVKVGVTVEGLEIVEYLHIYDYRMNSISVDLLTSKDVTTSIQRAVTKAIARHGLAINVYRGEDFPVVKKRLTADHKEAKQILKDIQKLIDLNKGKRQIHNYLKGLPYEYEGCFYGKIKELINNY
tara:strand:- start:2706 stop:3281 length:576 start_codon:yes stop_codon:yes gene_type:complete